MPQSTSVNAVLGAAVTAALAWTGVSPVIGGAVAAWLDGGDRDASITVGALSGLIVAAPVTLLYLATVLAPSGLELLVLVLVVTGFGALIVAASALGGYLWHYVGASG